MILHFAGLEHEVFTCLFLDQQLRVIAFEDMFRGTLDRSRVYPRGVVKRALSLNAASVVFAHNHPSGVPDPSAADEDLTSYLKTALAMIDVKVLDHIIVGGATTMSFAEKGLL